MSKHDHNLRVLWDGFDGWILVKCTDHDCDYMEYLFNGKEVNGLDVSLKIIKENRIINGGVKNNRKRIL